MELFNENISGTTVSKVKELILLQQIFHGPSLVCKSAAVKLSIVLHSFVELCKTIILIILQTLPAPSKKVLKKI